MDRCGTQRASAACGSTVAIFRLGKKRPGTGKFALRERNQESSLAHMYYLIYMSSLSYYHKLIVLQGNVWTVKADVLNLEF